MWLTTHSPDTILICIGTNDLTEVGTTPSVALSRPSSLADQIHSVRPSAVVLVANLPGLRANSQVVAITPQEVDAFNAAFPLS